MESEAPFCNNNRNDASRESTQVSLFSNKFQLKYKRRVYKMLHLDEKQLKAMHTRTNLRRLLDYVQSSQVEKIAKMCSKGLDPNFHCQETGGNSRTQLQLHENC